jgi:23S rRNA (adenine2030-N6)-methyltransferase
MNYRHAYHAGNFADVMKHTALVAVLLHLRTKQTPFVVIDTHGGRGIYDLCGNEAEKTGEAKEGIARLDTVSPGDEPLTAYLAAARSFGAQHYPGSPLIAARLLRPQDRLVAIEKHPEEYEALAGALEPFRKARAVCADGYERLAALLPPHERRGLVLMDPPFEAPDEFEKIADAFGKALRRFSTGIYLVWFPIKTGNDADALGGELIARGATRLLRVTLDVGGGEDGRLTQTGLLVANPPYGFDARMRNALAVLAAPLGRGRPAEWHVDWLATDH